MVNTIDDVTWDHCKQELMKVYTVSVLEGTSAWVMEMQKVMSEETKDHSVDAAVTKLVKCVGLIIREYSSYHGFTLLRVYLGFCQKIVPT